MLSCDSTHVYRSLCPDTLDPTPSDSVLRRQQHSPGKVELLCGETCWEQMLNCVGPSYIRCSNYNTK